MSGFMRRTHRYLPTLSLPLLKVLGECILLNLSCHQMEFQLRLSKLRTQHRVHALDVVWIPGLTQQVKDPVA